MSRSGTNDACAPPPPAWRPGLGARLFLAFFVIVAIGALASGSGIYALRQLGDRFALVEARLPRTVSALELSRAAERIVSAAPALLAVTDQRRHAEISSALEREARHLLATLDALSASDPGLSTVAIEPIVSGLASELTALGDLVARRLTVTRRVTTLRREVSDVGGQVDRLLAPWVEIVESEIAVWSDGARGETLGFAGDQSRLAAHLELQRRLRAAQVRAASTAEMLIEASASENPGRLRVLAFQINRALDDLDLLAVGFDPRLSSMLQPALKSFRTFANAPDSVMAYRREELLLLGEGSKLLEAIGGRSVELTAAVDRLGTSATAEIGAAIENALVLQERNSWLLVLFVAAALVASGLIVWLYVGRNILRRLNALSEGTLAIADGDPKASVPVEGTDEIAAMARAVEIFRKNTLERDRLLVEKIEAADQLEKVVEERTAELARSMREVEEKGRALESASQFKTRFLAAASHDLRQPLHALNLFVSQFRAASDPAERERLVERIGTAMESMNNLFDALLDMAKLEAGAIEPDIQRFAIAPLFARLQTTFSGSAQAKGLKLRILASPAWVMSDPVLLERVLINLVSNAVSYTRSGGIVVGCRRRGETLRIEVWDTGIGIPEKDRTRIFGEFVQLATGEDGPRGGLGLGLSIVSRLADLLGHQLEIASRVGKGSRFALHLPLAEAGETALALTAASVAGLASDKCVLIIDDDSLALDGLGGILRSWGCRVIAASCPDEARRALAAGGANPDLIIADVHLGTEQTGMGFIDSVRADAGTAIPAFLISGDTTPDCLKEAQARGFHLLHKPVAPIRLRAMVNGVTHRQAATGEVLRT